eukprot:TRINITY_DN13188_c0_g3_i1.p1 TRINITY_DN13188_c0_g3~~TRINITY_DN13188_c0_g3_i1.p1  ORF type:complete len:123 (-),score=4.51 TRINITY_DN13188_c0_g3_i1:34-402(-)
MGFSPWLPYLMDLASKCLLYSWPYCELLGDLVQKSAASLFGIALASSFSVAFHTTLIRSRSELNSNLLSMFRESSVREASPACQKQHHAPQEGKGCQRSARAKRSGRALEHASSSRIKERVV